MKKIWMSAIDTLRPTSEKHAPRHAATHEDQSTHHTPYDHRMSDRFRPALSTR